MLMVLTTLLVAAILGAILMNFMASQARLTHHQVSRIQAYYAAYAGMNYAYERLRTGTWTAGPPGGNCNAGAPCHLNTLDLNFTATFPGSISDVEITLVPINTAPCINPPVPAGINACISSQAIYTYTPETPF